MARALYKTLAEDLAVRVHSGALRPGDRLPSVRELSRDRGLSITTVLRAYRRLEDKGVIVARPRSGYFVDRAITTLPMPRVTRRPLQSQRVRTQDLIRDVLAATLDSKLTPFGAALPSPDLLPLNKLHRLAARVVRRNTVPAGMAIEPQGFAVLRQAIARQMIDAGCALPPDELIVTNGCMEALSLALRAVAFAGDTVAIESPVYYGIPLMIESLGMKVLEMPMSGEKGLDLKVVASLLERQIPAAFIVGANFQNPLGSVMADADKRTLVELLAHHRVPLIEDDIQGDLAHPEGPRPKALKAFDQWHNVIYCSSFSKTLAPGYRIGWVAPGRWYDAVWQLKLTTSAGSSAAAQLAIAEFLDTGAYHHHLRQLRRRMQEGMHHALSAIARYWPKARATHPEGSFILWIEMPAGVDAVKLYRDALAHGISIAPGPIFSASGRYRNHLRINCGHIWNDRLNAAMMELGQLIESQIGAQALSAEF